MGNRVLFFHEVYDKAWFEKIILLLKNKYTIIGIKDLEDYYYSGKKLRNTCHITIDDGDKSFYEVIYPILKKHNVPATLFVSPKVCANQENFWFQEIAGFDDGKLKTIIAEHLKLEAEKVSKYSVFALLKNIKISNVWDIISTYKKRYNVTNIAPRNMSVEQLVEVEQDGLVTIGAHTLNHPILANEDNNVCKQEISDSFKDLSDILGHRIKYFAYPNGNNILDFGKREIKFLKENGCKLSFTTETGNINKRTDALSILRTSFGVGDEHFVRIRLLVRPYWQYLKSFIVKTESASRLEHKKNTPSLF